MGVKPLEKITCKNCGKTLLEFKINGIVKKKCPKCKEMNLYYSDGDGNTISFIVKE